MWETAVLSIALVSAAAILAVFGRHDFGHVIVRLDRAEDLLLKLAEYAHDDYDLQASAVNTLTDIRVALDEHNAREKDRDAPRLALTAWPSDENGLR